MTFTKKLTEAKVRGELLRFVAERHDGYLEFIAEEWRDMQPPNQFNGEKYNQFTKQFCIRVSKSLDERIWKPELLSIGDEEIIPRRNTELYLKRRKQRFMRDIKLCLRRVAYASSVDLETHL